MALSSERYNSQSKTPPIQHPPDATSPAIIFSAVLPLVAQEFLWQPQGETKKQRRLALQNNKTDMLLIWDSLQTCCVLARASCYRRSQLKKVSNYKALISAYIPPLLIPALGPKNGGGRFGCFWFLHQRCVHSGGRIVFLEKTVLGCMLESCQ